MRSHFVQGILDGLYSKLSLNFYGLHQEYLKESNNSQPNLPGNNSKVLIFSNSSPYMKDENIEHEKPIDIFEPTTKFDENGHKLTRM